MTYLIINDTQYPATFRGYTKDREWNDRESKAITLEMAYEEAIAMFVDNVQWSIIYREDSYTNESGETITPDPIEYDNSEFCVSGPITDNRDGTMTIKMGKYTVEELLLMEVLG